MMCWELWQYYHVYYKLIINSGQGVAQDHSSLHFKQGSNLALRNLLKHHGS